MNRHPITKCVLFPRAFAVRLGHIPQRGDCEYIEKTPDQCSTADWLQRRLCEYLRAVDARGASDASANGIPVAQAVDVARARAKGELDLLGHLCAVAATHHNPRELRKLAPVPPPMPRKHQLHIVRDGAGVELCRYVVTADGRVLTGADFDGMLERLNTRLDAVEAQMRRA